jgi:exodeoxyribonuclease VII large subunit
MDRVRERIDNQLALMKQGMDIRWQTSVMKLTQYQDRLESLNPRNVLARGYALVYSDDGRVVASSSTATGRMEIEFADGRVTVERTDR